MRRARRTAGSNSTRGCQRTCTGGGTASAAPRVVLLLLCVAVVAGVCRCADDLALLSTTGALASDGRGVYTTLPQFTLHASDDCPAVSNMAAAASIPSSLAGVLLSPVIAYGCRTAHQLEGRVVVFGHVDTAGVGYTHVATLAPTDVAAGDSFGDLVAVTVSNDAYYIAATSTADGDADPATDGDSDSVVVFRQANPSDPRSAWVEVLRVPTQTTTTPTLVLDGRRLLYGNRYAGTAGTPDHGQVWWYKLTLSRQTYVATGTSVGGAAGASGGSDAYFGTSAAMSGDVTVASAPNDYQVRGSGPQASSQPGSCFIYREAPDGRSWLYKALVYTASKGGTALSMVGSTICIGSAGHAHIVQETARDTWTVVTELIPTTT